VVNFRLFRGSLFLVSERGRDASKKGDFQEGRFGKLGLVGISLVWYKPRMITQIENPTLARGDEIRNASRPLAKWMKFVLRFVAVYNVLAGLFMLIGYHETYKIIGMEKPDISFPIQLVGILVGLFGVGYYLVAKNPIENRNLLALGFWSKFLGSCLGTGYVLMGKLPPQFIAVYFFADVIYLPPFYLIMRRLYALARERDEEWQRRGSL
jgi:small multidrug resistance pump